MDHQQLFINLMALASEEDSSFYLTDQVGPDGAMYRIFQYRLASYTEFLKPDAVESRGTTFRQDNQGKWELVCLPPEKFFNAGENPLTMGLDFSRAVYSMVKEDGSLISTYVDINGLLQLKTKGSLRSEQAVAATSWINRESQRVLRAALIQLEGEGYTVNCEWTSPLNRVVVPYDCEKLIVLNARSRVTGLYMDRNELIQKVGQVNVVGLLDVDAADVPALTEGEGVVVFFGNDAWPRHVKIKTTAYLILHKLKDNVNNHNALFEAALSGAIDDLKASFADDPMVQTMACAMEQLVNANFNHFCSTVDRILCAYGHLERRDFAITIRQVLDEEQHIDGGAMFGSIMNIYLERDPQLEYNFDRSARKRIVAEYKQQVADKLGVNTDTQE